MRAFTLAVLAAGVLAAAPISASAATIDEHFGIGIGPFMGEVHGAFLPPFDPKLGTLFPEEEISVVGSTTWTPDVFVSSGFVVELLDSNGIIASQAFASGVTLEPQAISISLDGVGSGSTVLLETFGITEPTIAEVSLDGTVTYTYIPAVLTIPEPSTWAMMLLGFGGLGVMAYQRRRPSQPLRLAS
jgi:PEP-CTERM motif